MKCRFCSAPLSHVLVDLGTAPPSNSFLQPGRLNEPEAYLPLKVFVCPACFLVQVDEFKKAEEIFDADYVYFSSYSRTWLEHARSYAAMMTERFGYNSRSSVIEIASNDGYLLQYFRERGIPVLGIEPTGSTAAAAREKGIDTITEFFGSTLARSLAAQSVQADLLIGNNVLAHVPDINDFVAGLKIALKPSGIITMEFPHLMNLIRQCQFDTIYHEHFSYLSLSTVTAIFNRHGLSLFDVEELPTHGGSLRIFACHAGNDDYHPSPALQSLMERERNAGITAIGYYAAFQERVDRIRYAFIDFLINRKREGKTVAAYGAAAKGNTLLNCCGIRSDLLRFVADASPVKQGTFLPGSRIPVVGENNIRETRPEYIVILPWNLRSEISGQLDYIRAWGGRFVTVIPELEVF